MMKNKLKFSHGRSRNRGGVAAAAVTVATEEEVKWEMRPGGMLVQKRSENSEVSSGVVPPNLIKVRIAHGVLRYEISVNPQTTFGELKKLVAGESGLQPGEQRLIFKGKEREDGEYLDICGVKEQSKIVLIQDPDSIERRYMEMRKNAKIQTAHRLLDDVVAEVDKIAEQLALKWIGCAMILDDLEKENLDSLRCGILPGNIKSIKYSTYQYSLIL